MGSEDEIRRLIKSVCTPVAAPPEFKKRLPEYLMHEVVEGKTHQELKIHYRGNKSLTWM